METMQNNIKVSNLDAKGATKQITRGRKDGQFKGKKVEMLQQEITRFMNLDNEKSEQPILQPLKKYHWQELGQLQKKLVKEVDKNILSIKDYIKPHASSIYYDRKCDLLDILHAKKKADESSVAEVEREQQRIKDEATDMFQETRDEIVNIMHKYDIKHPMRGEEFEDHGVKKQTFKQKILGEAQAESSFLNYKYDQRKAMDFSQIRSEEYIKEEQAKFSLQKLIMRYRLFGKEAINQREFQKLLELGVIFQEGEGRRIKIKKRVKKWEFNQTTAVRVDWESDMSGSGSDTFETKIIPVYFDNETGDHFERNEGFEISPLCPQIFGEDAAKRSKLRQQVQKDRRKGLKRGSENSLDSYGDVSFQNEVSFLNADYNKDKEEGGGDAESRHSKLAGTTSRDEMTKKLEKKNPFSSQMHSNRDSIEMTDQTFTPDDNAKQIIKQHQQNMKSKNLTVQGGTKRNLKGGLTPNDTFQMRIKQQTNQNFDIDYNECSMLDSNLPSIRTNKLGPQNRIFMPHLANKFQVQRQQKRFNTIETGTAEVRIINEQSRSGTLADDDSANAIMIAETPISSMRMNQDKPFPSLAMAEHSKGSMGRIQEMSNQTPYLQSNQAYVQQQSEAYNFDEYIVDKQTGHKYKYQNESQSSFQTQQFRRKYGYMHKSQMTNYASDMYRPKKLINQNPNLKPISTQQSNSANQQFSSRQQFLKRNTELGGTTMKLLSQHTIKVNEDNRKNGASPFRFKSTFDTLTVRSAATKKKLGLSESRHNKSFLQKTPTLQDREIRALIGKYPVGDKDEDEEPNKKAGNISKHPSSQTQNAPSVVATIPGENSTEGSVLKGKLEYLTRNINIALHQSKQDKQDQIAHLVLQQFRNEELQRISEKLQEMDFADIDQIPGMYSHKQADDLEKLQSVIDVQKEFKEGKLDPNKYVGGTAKKK